MLDCGPEGIVSGSARDDRRGRKLLEVEDRRMARSPMPGFADLFPVCGCGRGTCSRCSGFQMTPRTAGVLWSLAQILADYGYDDVEEHDGDPMRDEGDWSLFDRYPR